MTENSESTGAERHADQAGDPTGPEDAGSRKEEATPDIGTDGNPGQTQVDAPDDDVGGAEDEESRTE
ncbi:MAG: hypothetical protein QOG93_1834 [Gaiellaceae bacterium]|nr:hypothetical protein [Gaiellaceae bacterium]